MEIWCSGFPPNTAKEEMHALWAQEHHNRGYREKKNMGVGWIGIKDSIRSGEG